MRPVSLEKINASVPVLILKLYHYSSLGIARTLGRLGVSVNGVNKDRHSPTAHSRYCRRVFEWDVDEAPEQETVKFLLDIAHQIGGRPMLLTTDDGNNGIVARYEKALREAYLFPNMPGELTLELYSKKGMYYLAKQHDIPTAETLFPESMREVREFSANATFPVMLKPVDSRKLQRRTGVRLRLVHSAAELIEQYEKMEDFSDPNLMLQEYIPGGDDSVWMFNGYFNEQSDCLAAFTGQKIRQHPPYGGMTSLGICVKNEAVEKMTCAWLKKLGYRGIVDMGYRYDARDGKYKLLDVNPRIGATFRLFVDSNGLDVVRAMYLDLTGQPVPDQAGYEGRRWIVEDKDLMSLRRYLRDGQTSLGEWFRSLGGVQEGAWFAGDDPYPFAVMCGGFVRTAFTWFGKALTRSSAENAAHTQSAE